MSYWAKLHVDILDDPKLMRAEREGMRHLAVLPWLIAYAKRADDDGRLTVAGRAAEPADIARSIPSVRAKQVAGCLAELKELGVLTQEEDGVLRFAAWTRRQDARPSDTGSAHRLRQKRYRDRKRAEKQDAARDVTSGVTRDAANVTGDAVDGDADADRVKDAIPDGNEEGGEHTTIGQDERYEPYFADREFEAWTSGRLAERPIMMSLGLPNLPLSTALIIAASCETRSAAVVVEGEVRAVLSSGTRFKGQLVRATIDQLHDASWATLDAMRRKRVPNPWAYVLASLAPAHAKPQSRELRKPFATKQERGRRNLTEAIRRREAENGK